VLVVVHHWRDVTWQRQDALGRRRTPYGWVADRHTSSLGYRWFIARTWYARAMAIPVVPWPGWWYRDAMCIHGKEGAWADPNPPYYGGMQFDVGTWLLNGGGRFASTANRAGQLPTA
jgi:hypothetical protein